VEPTSGRVFFLVVFLTVVALLLAAKAWGRT